MIAHSIAAEAILSTAFHEVHFKGIGEGKDGDRNVFLSAAKEFSTVHVPLYEKWYSLRTPPHLHLISFVGNLGWETMSTLGEPLHLRRMHSRGIYVSMRHLR